jgi:hypothetical protein
MENNEQEQPGKWISWNGAYWAVFVFLIIQIIFYFMFTRSFT